MSSGRVSGFLSRLGETSPKFHNSDLISDFVFQKNTKRKKKKEMAGEMTRVTSRVWTSLPIYKVSL